MRSVISLGDFTSADVRPADLFRKYAELTHADVSDLLLKQSSLHASACPACQSQNSSPAFSKCDMQYAECAECGSLFINPRPDDADMAVYYAESKAEKYWHESLAQASAKFRKEKIIEPRMCWIGDYAAGMADDVHIMDIHSHQDGWVEALAESSAFAKKTLLSPLVNLPSGLNHSFSIIKLPLADVRLEAKADMITLFEVVDRASDVDALFEAVAANLKQGGLCLLTSILAGYDIQVLWDASDSLLPPDRLNVLTVEGFEALFARHGFEVVEFSTPGGLDVDIVLNAMSENPDLQLSRPISHMLKNRSKDVHQSFQSFLQSSLLSSSGRMVVRKL